MLVPKGYSWKAAKAKLPASRQLWHVLRSGRTLLAIAIFTILILLWRSMGGAAGEMQRYAAHLIEDSGRHASAHMVHCWQQR